MNFWSLGLKYNFYVVPQPISALSHPAALCRTARPHSAALLTQKCPKNKYGSKCLKLSNSSRNAKKFLVFNHTRTVRRRTSALCGKSAEGWCLTFIKYEFKWETKFEAYRTIWVNFYKVNALKSAPPNANGGASEKAPSIGQTSHRGPIQFTKSLVM